MLRLRRRATAGSGTIASASSSAILASWQGWERREPPCYEPVDGLFAAHVNCWMSSENAILLREVQVKANSALHFACRLLA